MRHTLLPLNERKSLRRDYDIRLLIVLCCLISVSGIIGIGALFPAYIRERTDEVAALNAAGELKRNQDQSGRTAIESRLRDDNAIAKRLDTDKKPVRASSAIASVAALRENITLTFFVVTQSAPTVSVALQGNAPTRESLLAFKGRIEATLPSGRAELPISELAKSKNISFSMRVSYTVQ